MTRPTTAGVAAAAEASVDVLVISGPAGVGKSTAAFELSDRLREEGIGHALVDTDELDRLYPVPDDLARLTERNLTAVWQGFRERGATRVIVIGVFADAPSELAWIARAVPGASFTVVRLVAAAAVLTGRVRRREIGSGGEAQLVRTARQVAAMEADPHAHVHVVDTTTRSVVEVAHELRAVWPPRVRRRLARAQSADS